MTRFSPPFLPSMAELLDLEELDRDLYRGVNEYPANGRPTLYGGQVAAQALRAAGLTVPADRYPHSLHGYFLRVGRRDRPVLYKVDRDRDGNSFSARRVAAVQDGEVIFDLTASFHVERDGGEYPVPMPSVDTQPEGCPPEPYASNFPSAAALSVPPLFLNTFGDHVSNTMWVKIREPLSDDRLTQCCALTYLSDIGSGFGEVASHGLPSGGASLDHAIWFRSPIRADEWCLLDLKPLMAGGSRGLYSGAMYAADGRLGAMLTQELLLRNSNSRQVQ
jgi:acyl-CoA thioesterase II